MHEELMRRQQLMLKMNNINYTRNLAVGMITPPNGMTTPPRIINHPHFMNFPHRIIDNPQFLQARKH